MYIIYTFIYLYILYIFVKSLNIKWDIRNKEEFRITSINSR